MIKVHLKLKEVYKPSKNEASFVMQKFSCSLTWEKVCNMVLHLKVAKREICVSFDLIQSEHVYTCTRVYNNIEYNYTSILK